MSTSPLIIALDFPTPEHALALARQLTPSQCRLKVGKALFTRSGPSLVEKLMHLGFEVFLDLKFHDIPNTVAGAVRAAADLGVWMVNVHAWGGPAMLSASVEALAGYTNPPLLIGVTVLTSLQETELQAMQLSQSPATYVSRLAKLVQHAGLDGVVCSAQEARVLRAQCGPDFTLVTPGIRPEGSSAGDQARVSTPRQAIRAGANYLVVGRPVTQAADPMVALERIQLDIANLPMA